MNQLPNDPGYSPPRHPPATRRHVLCLGEALIDLMPEARSEGEFPRFWASPGGAPANVAVAVARLNQAVRFVGAVGDDAFGRLLEAALATDGVDVARLHKIAGAATPVSIVQLGDGGERQFAFYRGSGTRAALPPQPVADDVWLDTAWLHVGSGTLGEEDERSITLDVIRRARRSGLGVSFDPNLRPAFWDRPETMRRVTRDVIALADVVKLSAEDLAIWHPDLPADAVKRQASSFLEQGPSLVVLTRGSKEAWWITRQTIFKAPPIPVRAVDTTGAGDAFMGALLAQLVPAGGDRGALSRLGADAMRRMAHRCNVAAGLSCTRVGGIPSMPYAKELHWDETP